MNRNSALNELEGALQSLGRSGPGVRYTREQLTQSYVMLISGHFQAYCRDLHSEAIDYLIAQVRPATLQAIIRSELTRHRKLDQGNPNAGHLGADFDRLGMTFIPDVKSSDAKNILRLADLASLLEKRNAIAHQSFAPHLGQSQLKMSDVRRWRTSCDHLARAFDLVVHKHLHTITGSAPWPLI